MSSSPATPRDWSPQDGELPPRKPPVSTEPDDAAEILERNTAVQGDEGRAPDERPADHSAQPQDLNPDSDNSPR